MDKQEEALRVKICYAQQQLNKWRRDGNADQIAFWFREREEALDKLYPSKVGTQ